MNEILFFLHIFSVITFTLGAFALGQNALISCIALQVVLANLFVVKQMTLFGLNVTCADVFIVGGVIGLNLLQEYWGQKLANKAIGISFFVAIFYLVMTKFHILYTPSSFDTTHKMFNGILQFMPRITVASLFVHLFVQIIRGYFYKFLQKLFKNKYFVLRNFIVTGSTQFIDTVLFCFLGLYGIVGSISTIIVVSFTVKMITMIVATPLLSFAKIILNKNYKNISQVYNLKRQN